MIKPCTPAAKALTLYELNTLVREAIASAMDRDYWVEAELSEVREVRGHCFMELVQKDLFSPTPVARASAKCWKTTWTRIRPRFEAITGQPLRPGMKVMLLVHPDFHEAYGFSWIVSDVDPTYTLGDMARKRMEIVNQLKAEGVFDLQKELPLPLFSQHIAVISSENAAGYGDFCSQLSNNDYGFSFMPVLFAAVMQGDGVEQSIVAALNAINAEADRFDVVVIIRGGGATADMSGFDTLLLAENVVNFPLPVITGIGHERDECVLDMVSHIRVKTPTAAAALLIDNLAQVWAHVTDCQRTITQLVGQRMASEPSRLDRLSTRLTTLIHDRLTHEQFRLSSLATSLKPAAERVLTTHRNYLERLALRAKSLDPKLLLRRGYSFTTIGGKAVRDASLLKSGDEIVTQLEKGSVHSVVK
ncbi:MAG: exodeoxyribonuclease VII large subunit [Prevotella sp.]